MLVFVSALEVSLRVRSCWLPTILLAKSTLFDAQTTMTTSRPIYIQHKACNAFWVVHAKSWLFGLIVGSLSVELEIVKIKGNSLNPWSLNMANGGVQKKPIISTAALGCQNWQKSFLAPSQLFIRWSEFDSERSYYNLLLGATVQQPK